MLQEVIDYATTQHQRLYELHGYTWLNWLVRDNVDYVAASKLPEDGYVGKVYLLQTPMSSLMSYFNLRQAAPELNGFDICEWSPSQDKMFRKPETRLQITQYVNRSLRQFLPELLHVQVYDKVIDNHHVLYLALFYRESTPAIEAVRAELATAATYLEADAMDPLYRLYRRDGVTLFNNLTIVAPDDDYDNSLLEAFSLRVQRFYKLSALASL